MVLRDPRVLHGRRSVDSTTSTSCAATPASSLTTIGLRFFFGHRKNDYNYSGLWVDVAATDAASASFGGFSAVAHICEAALLLARRAVLRRVCRAAGRCTSRRRSPSPETHMNVGFAYNMFHSPWVHSCF